MACREQNEGRTIAGHRNNDNATVAAKMLISTTLGIHPDAVLWPVVSSMSFLVKWPVEVLQAFANPPSLSLLPHSLNTMTRHIFSSSTSWGRFLAARICLECQAWPLRVCVCVLRTQTWPAIHPLQAFEACLPTSYKCVYGSLVFRLNVAKVHRFLVKI